MSDQPPCCCPVLTGSCPQHPDIPVNIPQRNYFGYGVASPPLTGEESRAYVDWYFSGLRNIFSRKVCYTLPSGNRVHVKPGCRC